MPRLFHAAGPVVAAILLAVAGCETDSNTHRVGDVYERNTMPSADPDRPIGPHSLPNDAQGDAQMLHPTR